MRALRALAQSLDILPADEFMDLTLKDKTLKAAERYAQQGKFDAAINEYRKVLDADQTIPLDAALLFIGDRVAHHVEHG